jgi:hypothetical protein
MMKKNLNSKKLLLGIAMITCLPAVAHAGLIGTNVTLRYDISGYPSTIDNLSVTGNNPLVTCTGGGAGNANVCDYLNAPNSTQTISISNKSITYALSGAGAIFEAVNPNSFNFLSLTPGFAIGGVGLTTNIAGLSLSDVSFTSNSLSVNMSGLPVTNGEYFTTQLLPVPEPETYAMMLAGLGLIGFMARRKKTTRLALPKTQNEIL